MIVAKTDSPGHTRNHSSPDGLVLSRRNAIPDYLPVCGAVGVPTICETESYSFGGTGEDSGRAAASGQPGFPIHRLRGLNSDESPDRSGAQEQEDLPDSKGMPRHDTIGKLEDSCFLEYGVKGEIRSHFQDFDEGGCRLTSSKSDNSLSALSDSDLSTGNDFRDDCDPKEGEERSVDYDESTRKIESCLSTSTSSSSSNLHNGDHGRSSCSAQDAPCIGTIMPAIAEEDPQSAAIADNARNHSQDDCFIGPSPLSPQQRTQDLEIDHEALARRIAAGRSGSINNRSSSFDRRIIESQQFAEAVGEEELILNKIIEEDSSSDFDDDDIDEKQECSHDIEGEEELHDFVKGAGSSLTDHPTSVNSVHVCTSSAPLHPVCASSAQLQPQELAENTAALTSSDVLPLDTHVESPCETRRQLLCSRQTSRPLQPPPAPTYKDWKFIRPQLTSFTKLNGDTTSQVGSNLQGAFDTEQGYKGVTLPDILKRGITRGNYAQLHRKAWLEVSDKQHRYGKNLRVYYKHWEQLGHPFQMFFDWLDSRGAAFGEDLPNLPEIPRDALDSDTVLYITNSDITAKYALQIEVDAHSAAIILDHYGKPVSTGKEGWIFVLRDHVLYGSEKVTEPKNKKASEKENTGSLLAHDTCVDSPTKSKSTKLRQRFHHSSFFGGKAVASAGIFLTNEEGRLTHLYPHSGHYRPGEAHMQRALFFFQQRGVELSTFDVDMQQIYKVSRKLAPGVGDGDKENHHQQKSENGLVNEQRLALGNDKKKGPKKTKKTDNLHLMCGQRVAYFLAHKALMIEKGFFHQIHMIRRIPKDKRGDVALIISNVNI
ncbi:hypothetical protein THAOC_10824 [Thalassiosira oceanica]|uniref:Uncharacterized protein n=1 Tax=Thalassiosira oceanica TaxID=159749 RepID=K0T3U3_THAOC|nr:hypothetical protein THAOC_10824 [Thalassiosira oceanica]|mmetsp:Transcript_30500/g.68856  ORF Transcript_30500/g.68856 Transcript_30500/m.68856 type:complete len:825 (+) Transcript_30500:206-2680(+)|eukprot:EJK68046.1 hypothetical protein THAOC_10824 [Thalassiosira oceanica]